MHTTDARPPRPTRSELLVAEFSGVTHAYGANLALDHLDLRVGPGEVVAVLGPNGAGKTTALHLLMGLLAPRAGSVRLFGSDPRERAARERLGVMLQVTGVPEALTVLEHLRAIDPQLAAHAWGEDDPLTDRERQVLRLAGDGRSGPEIAAELGLAEGTVRNYLSEAISKLGASNRVEAARRARDEGWL